MVKRLGYEDVKNFIEVESNSGCKLLSTDYINNHLLLDLECKCSKPFKVSLLKFKTQNKRQCNECGVIKRIKNLRKTHREFVREVYELEGCNYSVLGLYEVADKNIKIKHNKCGCVYDVRPNNFLTGFRCPRCAMQHLDNTFVKSQIDSKEFELVNEYIDSKHKIKILHKTCGNTFDIYYKKFKNKKECPFCKKEKDRLIYHEFIKTKIEEKGFKLLSVYNNAKDKLDMLCPKGHFNKISWYHIQQGIGCPICSNQKVVKGINDVATTHPHYLKYFNDTEEAYHYSYGSNKEIIVKCPDCSNLKQIKINELTNNGFRCPKCGDGISYPEKIMFNALSQLNIKFATQKRFDWSQNKYYDFYIPSLNVIIETHGLQHYKDNKWFQLSLQEQKDNDILKQNLANNNGIKNENYIIIDSRKSNIEWIRSSILNSYLTKLLDISSIDWLKCEEYVNHSLIKISCDYWNNNIKSTKEIGKILKLHKTKIINYLKKGKTLGWCDYNAKDEIIKTVKLNGKRNGKKVISLTTRIIYDSATDAAKKLNGTQSNISYACINQTKTAYGQKWMYYNDFIKIYLINSE